jgi:hypothetical protein
MQIIPFRLEFIPQPGYLSLMANSDQLEIQQYLFSIVKIVEGATKADHSAVAAYARKLADDLEAGGERSVASRLRRALDGSKVAKLSLARAGQFNELKQANPPVDAESRLPTADESLFEPLVEEIFLDDPTKAIVDRFVRVSQASGRLLSHGMSASPSMLLSGPPGCGKTQLARYIAATLGMPMLTARADALISSYLGSTSKNIRMLFEHASSKPCILFLDEFDALAKKRDDNYELGELKRVVISLLQNLDALGPDHVVLAATNHEHLLDPAIWRRFTYHVHIGLPLLLQRKQLLQKALRSFDNDDLREHCAELTEGLSGSQVKLFAETLVLNAILDDRSEVAVSQLIPVLSEFRPALREQASSLEERVKLVRDLNSKYFTQVRLAGLFGVSQSTISKLLHSEGSK